MTLGTELLDRTETIHDEDGRVIAKFSFAEVIESSVSAGFGGGFKTPDSLLSAAKTALHVGTVQVVTQLAEMAAGISSAGRQKPQSEKLGPTNTHHRNLNNCSIKSSKSPHLNPKVSWIT